MIHSVLTCPMCQGTQTGFEFKSRAGYDIARCQTCRLAFTDARQAPPPQTLYPHFEQSDSAAQKGARSALSVFTLQRAKLVESFRSSGRLLDYGAGSGSFARFMAGRGFEAVGLEPYSLGTTLDEPHLKLVQAPLTQVKDSLGKFDVITLWHVLEHLEQPVALLSELRSMLTPDGVLVVSVPNFSSWQSTVFKGGWFHLDPPRHLLQFEPDTLEECLKRAGFYVRKQAPFLPEYGTSGWIQSTLNQVLPHQNFLYEWVKDRGALAAMPRIGRALHFAASVAGSVPLFLASIPVELMAAQYNKAAALTVVARAV